MTTSTINTATISLAYTQERVLRGEAAAKAIADHLAAAARGDGLPC